MRRFRSEGSRFRRVWALALSAALLGGCNTTPSTRINGVVTIDGVPAAGVQVTLTSDGPPPVTESRFTDANGAFSFDFVDEGPNLITIATPPGADCQPSHQEVDVQLDKTSTANFTCTKDYTVDTQAGYAHTIPQVESKVCWRFSTIPRLLPAPAFGVQAEAGQGAKALGTGATYSMDVVGPLQGGASGVISGQPPFTGTLGQDGTVRTEVRINRFGTYRNTVTVTSAAGVVKTATVDVTVTSAAGQCP